MNNYSVMLINSKQLVSVEIGVNFWESNYISQNIIYIPQIPIVTKIERIYSVSRYSYIQVH